VGLTGDSVAAMQATLNIPAFTKGKSKLSALEVEETRTIANVRIHVECVIGTSPSKIFHITDYVTYTSFIYQKR